jgi:hypothetical protein
LLPVSGLCSDRTTVSVALGTESSLIRRGSKESPERVVAANGIPAVSVDMRRRNVINIIERFQMKHALQEERELKNLLASPNGEFISGVPDKNGTRQQEIFENEQVRVSTTSVLKGTNWSMPHDGRDRVVVLLDQINQLAETNEKDSPSSAWRVTRIPANSDINVPNNSDQTKILMILEFKDTGVEESISKLRSRSSLH